MDQGLGEGSACMSVSVSHGAGWGSSAGSREFRMASFTWLGAGSWVGCLRFPHVASFPPPASHLAGPFSPCGFSLQPDGLDFLTWWLSPQGGQWKLLGLSGPQDQHPRMSLPPHSAVGASPRAGPDCRAGQGDSASWSEEQHPDIVRKKSRWGRGLLLCFAFFFQFPFFIVAKRV